MSKSIVNPLAALVAQAAKTLPRTGGDASRLASRLNPGGPMVIVADVSASMTGRAWGAHSRITLLSDAVDHVRQQQPCRIIAFSTEPVLDPAVLPPAGGSTNMARAIALAGTLSPSRTLIISDGEPDDETAALRAAETLTGIIDTLYIGPEESARAIDFLRRLAAAGLGKYQRADLSQPRASLRGPITALLGHRT